ncbi:hypothetical protein MJO28_001761 [Puccinia striiformis f. sp. tritici]|uniref:Uncharacterized protein n=1 Tax=Puccinia striiformis f. sp. tritici TaxID=168172 RepID=A0ACC0EV95_9BASI|nr:hypothetical protein MJO28_001761 [Puccinia striiformis f. sp. tritici]
MIVIEKANKAISTILKSAMHIELKQSWMDETMIKNEYEIERRRRSRRNEFDLEGRAEREVGSKAKKAR